MLGYPVNPVFYAMNMNGAERPLKIGKDETWPSRFVQARCHTPDRMQVAAIFSATTGNVSQHDGQLKSALRPYKLRTRAQEWYDVRIERAISLISSVLPGFTMSLAPTTRLFSWHTNYDDWRECREEYMQYAWRLFVHAEEGTSRLKVSYGALYDTHYLYCATYNWRPLSLAAGFEHIDGRAGNREVELAWSQLMKDSKLGNGLAAEEVGWLSPSATIDAVRAFLASRGLTEFDLARPKPRDAPLRDATMSRKFTPFGEVPNQKWVRR